ncbi:MAG: hypothetical protein QOD42_1797 [Sphingomonadales bacterium]|jgi:hypothetical protein|nr:hypothetical protein [Sphingomonadales bacterium]
MLRRNDEAARRERGPAAACEAVLRQLGETAVARDLGEAMADEGLTSEGRALCRTLRPKFVSESDYRQLVAEGRIALDLFGRAERRVRSDAALRHSLFGSHPYAPLIEAHLDHDIESVGRLDALVDGGGRFRFIEYNAGLCGGAFCSEGVADIFLGSPVMTRLQDIYSLRFIGLRDRYLRTLVEGFRRARRRPPGNLAVILPPGAAGLRFAENAELKALVAFAGQSGLAARFARLEDMLGQAGPLRDQAGEIDVAIVVDWATTLAACPPHHRLWQCGARRGTWIANSLGASVLRSGKHLLAVLSDPSWGLRLQADERAWIDAHIPWSRLLAPGPSTARGAAVDLVDWVRENRRSLVLKPCFSMGGRGVSLGWECGREDWELAVDRALLTPSIVQERVVTASEVYPVATAAGVGRRALAGDICVYTWAGAEVGGLYCRVSETGLLNLSAPQGSLVPAFLFGPGAQGVRPGSWSIASIADARCAPAFQSPSRSSS